MMRTKKYRHYIKRITALLLIGVLLVPASAKDWPLSGEVMKHEVWSYDRNTKTVTFSLDEEAKGASGSGYLPEGEYYSSGGYDVETSKWSKEAEYAVFEEGLEKIECEFNRSGEWDYATFHCVKEITLPTTMKVIGEKACYDLSLSKIELNEGLEVIGEEAFAGTWLKSIVMPSTLKSIGNCAFQHSDLETVVLNEGLEEIGHSVFSECYKLEKVTLPSNIAVLEDRMFSECEALKNVVLPESLKVIKADVFGWSGVRTVTIPKNVEKIGAKDSGNGMFYKCKSLKKVNITTRKLKKVYKDAFINTPPSVVFVVPKGMKKKYTKMFRKGGLSKKIKIKESKKW